MYEFFERVIKTDSCWIWQKPITDKGYGIYFSKGKRFLAHRFSYEIKKGKIPDGLVLDHICRKPACVNPDHLEAVTQKENVLRGFGSGARFARRTHCDKGHEFSEENTYLRTDGGSRKCRKCMDSYWRAKDKDRSRWSRMSKEQRERSVQRNRIRKVSHS